MLKTTGRVPLRCSVAILLSMSLASCDEGDERDHHELELITTVSLTLTPDTGGAPVLASYRDVDGPGGMPATGDPVVLTAGTNYMLDIAFLNEQFEPAEDITEEIREEAEEHWVFVYGNVIQSPSSSGDPVVLQVADADMESEYGPNLVGEDLPVGLRQSVAAVAPGVGALRVMLRHLPPLNDQPQKVATLPATFAAGMPVAGDVDADVSFDLTVQ